MGTDRKGILGTLIAAGRRLANRVIPQPKNTGPVKIDLPELFPAQAREHSENLGGMRNPAGSKMIREFYRAKHGRKADYETSLQWYRSRRV